jgi:hypothetical protein
MQETERLSTYLGKSHRKNQDPLIQSAPKIDKIRDFLGRDDKHVKKQEEDDSGDENDDHNLSFKY